MDEARRFTAADLRTGLQAEFERDITDDDIAAFAELSRDRNPLHLDEAYARQTNYQGRIVHGAFQVGLASAMAGMYLPGREVVVGSFQCRFPAPLYYPCRVRVQGEITAWVPQSVGGTLRVRVVELSSNALTSEIHVGFSLHEKRGSSSQGAVSSQPAGTSQLAASSQRAALSQRTTSQEGETPLETVQDNKPVVLLTGAGGGLGQVVAAALSSDYHVIGVGRSQGASGLEWIAANLMAPDWEEEVERRLAGRKLYGVVHAAWPAGPQGSLLEVESEAVRSQVEFGGVVTVRIARFLRRTGACRLVILGTTAATIKPVLNMSAYSLGKATLEHTVRLLAPELARGNITINLVAPSFVPVGMNSAKTNRVILTETAKVPMGKLCAPEDVAGTVGFFLSPAAAFITGQILPLTGGQL